MKDGRHYFDFTGFLINMKVKTTNTTLGGKSSLILIKVPTEIINFEERTSFSLL